MAAQHEEHLMLSMAAAPTWQLSCELLLLVGHCHTVE
jgi:hypothetical protein